ncbi:MAG: hypothetical protein E7K72_24765 [Roseomonas mucosa]|nr:hypothetical protein [Roseomonas mucosa]
MRRRAAMRHLAGLNRLLSDRLAASDPLSPQEQADLLTILTSIQSELEDRA